MCTNYVNYIRGRTYIGNFNTRVEEHNLRSSRNKWMVRDINVLNDCCICMWSIVCMYAGISGRNSFKRGRTVKPRKSIFFFSSENERIGNSYPERYKQNPRFFLDLR